jgi:hypothetical protein
VGTRSRFPSFPGAAPAHADGHLARRADLGDALLKVARDLLDDGEHHLALGCRLDELGRVIGQGEYLVPLAQ